MNYAELLSKIPDLIQLVALFFLAVCILATVVSRLTYWTKKDDAFVDSAAAKFLKFLSYFPTVGINPRTKAMEAALKDLQSNKVDPTT